jgi:N-acetylglucosamine-6-phosphate deacetylase
MSEERGEKLTLAGAIVHAESKCLKGAAVELAAGKVADITRQARLRLHVLELPETWHIVPGFIDSHIHGAAGVDVMDGTGEALEVLCRYLPSEGTTSFLATTMTASSERIFAALGALAAFRPSSAGEAEILGVHLEGPFIAPEKAGAQGTEWMVAPDIELYRQWQTAAGRQIKVVTLAPELPGALELIDRLTEDGVLASTGHTNCGLDDANSAIAGGCRRATHLFNAMSGLHHRAPGAACAALLADDVMAEVIPDGVHVAPSMLRLARRMKTPRGLMAVTDSMRAKGLDDGVYDLGGEAVHVKDQVARRDSGTLAGSVLRMEQSLRNLVQMFDCSLDEALQMVSTNPAFNLGVSARKGTLAPEKDADLVVLDEDLNVRMTLCRGRVAFDSAKVVSST